MSQPASSVDDYTPDRIKKLAEETPPSGPKRPLGLIAFVATLGSLLFGYDTKVISGGPALYVSASRRPRPADQRR